MRIIQLVENIDESYWGPAKSIPQVSKYLIKNGANVEIRTTYDKKSEHNITCQKEWIKIIRFPAYFGRFIRFSWKLLIELSKTINKSKDTIFINTHNLRTRPTFVGFFVKLTHKNKVKLIITPRGSLFPRSLSQKKIIKKIIRILFQKRMLQKADIIHVTSDQEEKAVKDLWIKSKIINISNWIDLDEFEDLPSKEESQKYFKLDSSKKYLFFISRIHKKKWFDHLVDIRIDLAKKYSDLDLVIAGPKQDRNLREDSIKKVKKNKLEKRFHDLGVLDIKERIYGYRATDIFVLPSHTENFGIVIAEALACERIVATTDQTPWDEINQFWSFCGHRESIKKYLNQLLQNPIDQKTWKTGAEFVKKHYSRDHIAQKLILIYKR